MKEIVDKIIEERNRQEGLWKEQNWPSVMGYIPAIHYNIPSMNEAKETCEERKSIGQLTWTDIVLEEMCEVVEATSDENRIEELTQLSALCIAWIQSIKRNPGKDFKQINKQNEKQ